MLATNLTAWAQTERLSAVAELDGTAAKAATATTGSNSFKLEQPQGKFLLKVPEQNLLNAEKKTSPILKGRSVKAAEPQTADISGYYVGTYLTLASGSFDGGSTMQVVPDTEGDSLTIKNFWNGCNVRAHYDKTTSTVTIPRQYMLTDESLGQLDIAATQPTGAPDYNTQITGTVKSGGIIDFTQAWWGIYVQKAGANKDKFVAAYYNLAMGKPNGTMMYKTASGQQAGYYVIINQTSPNMLTVTNIFNRGLDIEVKLNRNRTAEINNQVAFINASGSWTMIKCIEFNEQGNLTNYSPVITIEEAAASNNNTLSWTDWSILCAEAKSFAGRLTDARLTADTPWSYPELSINDFEGEGTVENPYLISSLDHLILLADKVNNDDNYVGVSGKQTYTRTYLGKHFALTNDIDMQNYSFEAIGKNWNQRFAGSLDGRGHTIRGLNVNGGGDSYAGLFGICDTTTVIKNLTMESPVVSSTYFSAGAVAAWCIGSIENITVNNPNVSGARSGNGAVAGIVSGKMENCHVTGGIVMGTGFLGGVVGEVHGGIHNCSAVGTKVCITGDSSPSGGVAGNILDADGSDLYFSGLMTYANLANDNGQIIGGVVGTLQNVALRNSFSSGVVRGYSSQSQIGGVVGILSSGTVENCYSSGMLHCYTRMGGGIVGQIQLGSSKLTPKVINCYTSATVEVETYQYDRNNCCEVIGKILDGTDPELTNIYYDKQVTDFGSIRFGTTTAELTSPNGPKGFSSDVWTFTEGAYPRIKTLAETEAAKYSASAVVMSAGDSFKKISNNTPLTALGNTVFCISKGQNLYTEGHYSKIAGNNTLEIGTEFGTDTLYVINGDVQTYHFVNIAPIPFEGAGTAESPLLIKTKDDLIKLSEATTAKRQTFDGMYFAMTNDIDLELDPAFDGICADGSAGAASIKFQGIFDGQGHTIENVLIPNRVVWTKEPTETSAGTLNTSACRTMGGLFGRLGESGVVRNLSIGAGSKFEMYGTCAAFVASLDGTVENCRNYADVTGYSCWVGGIAGMVNKGGRIINCYNAGNIRTGYANVGGIAGSTNGMIENCVNTGDISASDICTNYLKQLQRAGGIAGGSNASSIKNCVNYGTVYAQNNNAGGICASMEGTSTAGSANDNIVSCLNLGNVYCGNKATTGAILGLKGTKNVENVYFDAQTTGIKAGANSDIENMNGIETEILISGQALEGLTTEIWDYQAGMYPALKAYAEETKVAAARKVIAKAATGDIFTELSSDVELGDGATWTLADGKTFKIENGKLIVPKNVSAIVADTLVAVNGADVRRPMFIQALPAMPLTGEGTAENPYLINNVDEWNALAAYMDNTGKNLSAKTVRITADLDFTGKTPSRIGADGITVMAGTVDGDNHTIKGFEINSIANTSCGLFGTIDAGATVKNLIFEGTVNGTHTFANPVADKLYGTLENIVSNVAVTTNKANVSGVVGNAYTGAVLNGVVFSGSIKSGMASIGGLVATGAAGVTYSSCEFNGKIEQTGSYTKATAVTIGGFVSSSGAATFENCKSNGEITVATPEWAHTVAGFLGNAVGAKGNGLYTFTSCSNATSISAAGKVAGFIAGGPTSSSAAANAQYVMTDCHNTGDISAVSTKSLSTGYPTAGLVTFYTPGSSFTRCYNTGTIISNFNVYAGGIAGQTQGTPGSSTTPDEASFTDCYNEGSIIADGNQGGGITGAASGKVIFKNCYNTADIEGNRMVAGITSQFAGNGPQMINCYNTGNITGKTDRVGGLIAWGSPVDGLVEGCWNTGNVSSLSEVQSTVTKDNPSYEIGGLAANSGATFRNCYNAGNVKGLARAAGLVATPEKNKTQFINCYNAGRIDAPADSCGSIVGVSITNGKQWTADNKMDNTWYLDINSSDNDEAFDAKKISAKELAALDLGEGFTSPDDYTYPVVKTAADNEVALFHAAELILADDNTFTKVTKDFNVGGTPVVKWSSDCASLVFNGNSAQFEKSVSGTVVVTATAGELTKTYELTVDFTSGIDAIGANGSENVVSRKFFNAAGVEIAAPQTADGQVYMVIEKLNDGTTRVIKIANKK